MHNGFVSYHANTIQFRSWCANQIKGKARGRHQWLYVGLALLLGPVPLLRLLLSGQPEWCWLVGQRQGINGPLTGGGIYSPSLVTLLKTQISEPSLTGEMRANKTHLSERVGDTGALKSPQGTDGVYDMPRPRTPSAAFPSLGCSYITFVSLSH